MVPAVWKVQTLYTLWGRGFFLMLQRRRSGVDVKAMTKYCSQRYLLKTQLLLPRTGLMQVIPLVSRVPQIPKS